MRMRWRRILPATWPRTMWSLSSFTLNIAFGRASTTSPSNSTFSSLLTEGEGSAAAAKGSAGRDVLRRVDRRPALRGRLRRGLGGLCGRRLSRLRLSCRRLRLRRLRAALGCGPAVVRPAVAGGALLLAGVLLLLVRPAAALGLVLGLGLDLLVLALERLALERLLGLGEVAAALLGDLHVLLPDRGRVRAARDADRRRRRVHRHALAGEADPDRRRQVRREADEPRVGVVVRRAGLPAGGAADLRSDAGAALHVLLKDLRRLVRDAVAERPGPRGLAPVAHAAVGERDAGDRLGAVAPAAGGDGRVRVGHLERRDAVLQAAEDLARVGVELALDAHLARGLLDLVRPDVEGELLEDGVVRGEGGAQQADAALVGVRVRLDLDRAVLG